MRFPWQRRMDDAKAQTKKAQHEYEWTVQNRSTVSTLVHRVIHQGKQNHLVEHLHFVVRGGHR